MDASDNNSRQLSTSNAQEREDTSAQTGRNDDSIELFKQTLDFINNEYENKISALWVQEKFQSLKTNLDATEDQLLDKFNQEQKDKINFSLEYSKRGDLTENDLEEGKNEFRDLIKDKMLENLHITSGESEVEIEIESQETELTGIEGNILENIKNVRQEEEKKLQLVREFQNFIEGFRNKLAHENNNQAKLNEFKHNFEDLRQELISYELNQEGFLEESEVREFEEYKGYALKQLNEISQEIDNMLCGETQES